MKINGFKIAPEDEKYIITSPDYYDVDKNKAVVARTIKKNEELRKKKMKLYEEHLRERSDALASYLTYVNNGHTGGVDGPEKYFGRKYLAHLRGESIVSEIKSKLGIGSGIIKP